MKSVLQDEKKCYFCELHSFLEEHHIFGGSNRKISERRGYKVYLCHFCHNEPPDGVHFNRERSEVLKRIAQQHYEKTYKREEFIKEFGRNYL